MTQVADAVRECAEAAHAAAGSIAAAGAGTVDAALLAIADRLLDRADAVLAANEADVDGADLAAGDGRPAPARPGPARRHGRPAAGAGRGAAPAVVAGGARAARRRWSRSGASRSA